MKCVIVEACIVVVKVYCVSSEHKFSNSETLCSRRNTALFAEVLQKFKTENKQTNIHEL